jgi:hypothetical protein
VLVTENDNGVEATTTVTVQAEHVIHLHLDAGAVLLDEELHLITLRTGSRFRGEPQLGQLCFDATEKLGEGLEGLVPTRLVVGVDEVEIDREAGHVPQEEVDRRSALQGEPRTLEDDRGALEGRRIRTRNQEDSVR